MTIRARDVVAVLGLLAWATAGCGGDTTTVDAVAGGGEQVADEAAPGDEPVAGGGEQIAAEPVSPRDQPSDPVAADPGQDGHPDSPAVEPLPDVPRDPDEPPTTIKPPPGYEPLCELGMAMWPMTSTLDDITDLDASVVAGLYRDLAALLNEYLPRLPSGQLVDDIRTLAAGVSVIAEVVSEYQGPFGAFMEQALDDERLAPLMDESGEFTAAGDRWDEVMDENCGLRL